MSMIATGGPAAPPARDHVPSSPWWPAVSFAAYRAASRIDRTANDPQAWAAVCEAVASVNNQLVGWLGNQIALDPTVKALQDIAPPAHQEKDYYCSRYLRAVYCAADGLLAESYRDFDSTGEGDRRADAMEGRIDAYRRESQYAIADITGVARRRVELL
jgi:Phage head completion protein (GPL)